jgi:tetratricopeptide (TPR) repeat protein
MKSGIKKRLYLILSLCSVAIVCPIIIGSKAKAQQQSGCYIVALSGQVRDSKDLCSPNTGKKKLISMVSAEEFFNNGREFDIKGQHQEAIIEYTQAIQLDPNYVEAYFYRGNALALEGQPQEGIEDLQKAASICESRGQSEWAAVMRQHEEMIQEGIEDGEF